MALEHRSPRCLRIECSRRDVAMEVPVPVVLFDTILRFLTGQAPRFHEGAGPPEVRVVPGFRVEAMLLCPRKDLPLLLV